MSVLYIKEQGAYVKQLGERILVTKNNKTLLDIPIINIENIAIIGNVQVTTQALHLLMKKGIDINYFTYGGNYIGNTSAEASKNIFLRFEQYKTYMKMEKRLSIAKLIINNKISNQISIIKEHCWRDSDYNWKKDVNQLEKYKLTIAAKSTPNELLGVEGICSNIYFKAYGQMFKGDFEFNGRNKRPPKDPINAIMSLAYTFLTKEICNALEAESFETYLGFLHGIRYGRKSLALDIVEEFRQPIVDRFVIILFNKRILNKYDFEFREDKSVVLNEDGFSKFCYEYERWINGNNKLSKSNSFRKEIIKQINILKRTIGENVPYIPYNWEIIKNVCN